MSLFLIFAQLGIQTIFSFMRVYLLTEVGEKSLADMRKDVYSKLLTMPMSFFTEKRVGELSNRISADLSQIQDAVSFTLAEFRNLYLEKRIDEAILERVIAEQKGKEHVKVWKEKVLTTALVNTSLPRIGSIRSGWKRKFQDECIRFVRFLRRGRGAGHSKFSNFKR